MLGKKVLLSFLAVTLVSVPLVVSAQDTMPTDNGIGTYYTEPRYRPSEEHPLRWVAYALHPVGWIAREVFVRPVSYLISSTEITRSFFGYREPNDFRSSDCFSTDASVPDCRSIPPYNYDSVDVEDAALTGDLAAPQSIQVERSVYFPDVNFDFDKNTLNDLGKGKVRQIAKLLQENSSGKVVLEGHTDAKGTDAYNDKLGQNRNEAVRQELAALGIPAAQITSSVSFGKTKPVFTEQENWANAVNRRVEVHLDNTSAVPTEPAK